MKVIDLLNKIANGEEVPKEIWFKGRLFRYREDSNVDYIYTFRSPTQTLGLFGMVNDLNEVILAEEDKEIEYKPIQELKNKRFTNNQKQIAGKINELIKAVNELKKGK
jgi:hypothetical protein